MDTSFSDDEKRFVLGEMIKVSSIDVPTLVEFIRANQLEPRWLSMQLPGGRNMHQCMGAVDNMFQIKFPPPDLPGYKRSTLSDMVDPAPKRQAVMMPSEQPMPPARIIQPRPASNSFISMSGPPMSTPSAGPSLTATGKKRGRPSKADKEAQARANYSRSVEYAAITPAPPPPATLRSPREYAASPGYEVSSYPEQKLKKRERQGMTGSPQPQGPSYAMASPVSTAGTPRMLPELTDKGPISPEGQKSVPPEKRSPSVLPQFIHHHHSYHHERPPAPQTQSQQQHQQHQHQHPHVSHQEAPDSRPPSQGPMPPHTQHHPPARPPAVFDPIFPGRDRSRAGSDRPTPAPAPAAAPPITNRG
ncbi:uncharacterized protein B0I36DRAFT_70344 [Microdochium trichocladiopsis]|uniref:Uncharacterized protein n=1 Tax=Microdochium trichocladiopsis TaxID=1682393 RepID=A0A9P9BUR2_9PEZI|nr:uncharacterized protein B0I36DRAFT_70344 [Microdochium trichocladiopsis]KAH7037739.1 hypothetical protein B0I36DRAFT_70344 [Microdochium trichocladiopsis]